MIGRVVGLSLLTVALLGVNGCSSYAPGYEGWTPSQVKKIKESARQRYELYPKRDESVLGVNYISFERSGYHASVNMELATECKGLPYEKIRSIESVILKTSVCLSPEGQVSRIVFDLNGPDEVSLAGVIEVAKQELKDNYGAPVVTGLENPFISRVDYKRRYIDSMPTREDLLSYSNVRTSDYISSVKPAWVNRPESGAVKFDHFVLDVKFLAYAAIRKAADKKRDEGIKEALSR